MQKISLQTDDGVTLVGVFETPEAPRAAALLLHMMPATKESYAPLQARLLKEGIASLAIDLRGHGESVQAADGSFLDHKNFKDDDHAKSRIDAETGARRLLQETKVPPEVFLLVGASIGANLVLEYAAAHQAIPAVVALSPGLVYRGIAAMPAVKSLKRDQKLLLVASDEDTYSSDSVEKLAEVSLAKTEVIQLQNAGHGTSMFDADPKLLDRVVEWMKISLP